MTPKQQHEAHAKKIIARRTAGTSNDRPAVKVETPTTEVKYSRKELRTQCTDKGIDFKKKDTVAQLTELLKG